MDPQHMYTNIFGLFFASCTCVAHEKLTRSLLLVWRVGVSDPLAGSWNTPTFDYRHETTKSWGHVCQIRLAW
jgi:hypothetical protein